MRPKQVGRPVDADSEATRRKIFESASRCFSTYGYGKTTIREVAADARGSWIREWMSPGRSQIGATS